VPPALVRQWPPPSGGSGSSSSLSWLLVLLFVCCCFAWATAGVGAAWTFFKPKKNSKHMVQHHNHEMNGICAERLQSQIDNHHCAPLSRSSSMSAKQEYDLLKVSPGSRGLRPGVAPLAPPPAPFSSVRTMELIQTSQGAPLLSGMAMEPIKASQVPVVSPMQLLPQPQPVLMQQLQSQYVPEGRVLQPSTSTPRIEPLAHAQASRPIMHQASSALRSSTSFVTPAQPTHPVVRQASSALQSSTSFGSQAAEVSSLAQPQPMTAQLPQMVRPPTSQFAEPLATPQIAPIPALHPPQPVPLAPQALAHPPEPEFDLVTVTPKGYEVRHF